MAGGGGQFNDVWTLSEAASRHPFHLGHFLGLLWENTSGYLLAACLVSLAAVVLSWVYMVRAGPLEGPDRQTSTGPGRRTRTGSAEYRAGKTSAAAEPPSRLTADSNTTSTNPGPAPASSDLTSPCAGPPPPPAEEEPSSKDQGGVPDLVEMAHHLPARVKQAELNHIRRTLHRDMTDEQRRRESEVERDQMAAILALMQQNSDKFGEPSLDDMQAQLKLYM